MLDVLTITGPIFLAALLGFRTTRARLFAKADMRVLGRFVVSIELPALLFNALSQRPIGDVPNGGSLAGYLAGSLALLGAGHAWRHRVPSLDPAGSSIVAMGMTCTNGGFIGYPNFALAYGHGGVGAASMLVATVASFFTLSGLLRMFANHPDMF